MSNPNQNDEEALISRGDDAENLMQNEAFSRTVNSLVDSTFQAFCNSKPEDSQLRENTYHHYRAVVDIVNTLKQSISVRDEIHDKNKSNHDNSEAEGMDH